jgi:hypothetical protein
LKLNEIDEGVQRVDERLETRLHGVVTIDASEVPSRSAQQLIPLKVAGNGCEKKRKRGKAEFPTLAKSPLVSRT